MSKIRQRENKENIKDNLIIQQDLINLIKQKEIEQINALSIEYTTNLLNNSVSNSTTHENVFSTLFLVLNVKKNFNSLKLVEILDKSFKKVNKRLMDVVDTQDKFIIFETLKLINLQLEEEGFFSFNLDCLCQFIVNCLKKDCKLESSFKFLALSTLKKILEIGESRDKIIREVVSVLFSLSGGKSNVKTKFILMCFENNWFHSLNELFEVILNQPVSSLHYTEDLILNIVSNSNCCNYSFVFSLCFIRYFIEENGEEKLFSVFLRVFKEIVQFKSIEDNYQTQSLCKRLFNLTNITDAKKVYTRKSLLFCLDILMKKKHTKRLLVAKTLNKINLKGLLTNKKGTFKLAKSFLKGENLTIFETGIRLIANIKEKYLLNLIDIITCPLKKAILFEYTKHFNLEKIYFLYLEIIGNNQEVDFSIGDIKTLARAFYVFPSKEVAQYLDIDNLKVEDIHTAELAIWYSKYHPSRVDEIQIASYFLQTDKLFLISKNISFFVKLISILNNLSEFLNCSLKKNLISSLKDLLFFMPYTKEVGLFLTKVNCNRFTINSKTEYSLVVLASCNHLEFKTRFIETEWSPLKDRALIYILTYQPEYGMNYSWRLLEIINSSDSFNVLELLNFLTETFKESFSSSFGDEFSTFYFSFIDENQKLFYCLMENQNRGIVLQTSILIYTALKNKCLLPEMAISPFISYTCLIPVDINLFEKVIIKNINRIIKERSLKGEEEFIFRLFKKITDKVALLENIQIETNVLDLLLKTFNLILKAFKNSYKKIILRKIEDFQISITDEDILEKLSSFQ